MLPQLYLPPFLVRKKLESEVEDLRAALESEQVMRKQLEKKKLDIKPTTPEVTQTKASPEEIKKFQDEIALIKVCIFDLKLKYRPTQTISFVKDPDLCKSYVTRLLQYLLHFLKYLFTLFIFRLS